MHTTARFSSLTRTIALAALFFSVIFIDRAHAQGIATPPLQIADVPRHTQAGEGPGRYVPPVPAKAELPTLWLVGDSTVRNGSKGDNGPEGQWGWGAPITAYFDLDKINVVNRALGGMSSRTFYDGEQWKSLKPLIKKGDFVVIQFGANDSNPEKGSLKGVGNETEAKGEQTVHTFGWYLERFVEETRAQGATPILCSLTPRKSWTEDGKFSGGGSYTEWAREVAEQTGAAYVPLNEIIARTYEKLGPEKVDTLFVPAPKEKLHTGWDGAVVNAECVVAGLKALPRNPFEGFFSERAQAIPAATGR